MAINTKKGVQELISYSIVTDKNGVIRTLKRNGVKLRDNASDAEVTKAVLIANKHTTFRKDLANFLQGKLKEGGEKFHSIVGNSQDFGFTGVDDFTYEKGFTGVDDFNDFTGWDDFKSANATTTFSVSKPTLGYTPKGLGGGMTTSSLSTSVSDTTTQKTGKTKVGSALAGIWGFVKENVLTKDNINAGIQAGLGKVNADTAARQNALDQQAIMLQQQQQDMANQLGKKQAGVSGTTIIYIGVGLIAVVGISYLIFKKK